MREIVNAPHLAEDDYPRIEQSLGSDASCGNQVPLAAGAALVAISTPEQSVTLDMPGKLAELLRATEPDDAELAALDQGVTVRRGRVTRCASPPLPPCAASRSASHRAPRPCRTQRTRPAGVREPHRHPRGSRPALSSQRRLTRVIPWRADCAWAVPTLRIQTTIFPRVRPRSACAWASAISSRG